MNLASIHQFTLKYGGPWKVLLLSMRGGQFIGGILALGAYAWIISVLSSHNLSTQGGVIAIEVIGVYVSIYTLASHPATWYYLEKAWFHWASILCDALAIAGSIAVAVLARPSTLVCSGIFKQGERGAVGSADASQACKLQKAVFATGITNSLMFLITLLIHAWLIRNPQRQAPKSPVEEQSIDESSAKPAPSHEPQEA